jgi:hypothetical protein
VLRPGSIEANFDNYVLIRTLFLFNSICAAEMGLLAYLPYNSLFFKSSAGTENSGWPMSGSAFFHIVRHTKYTSLTFDVLFFVWFIVSFQSVYLRSGFRIIFEKLQCWMYGSQNKDLFQLPSNENPWSLSHYNRHSPNNGYFRFENWEYIIIDYNRSTLWIRYALVYESIPYPKCGSIVIYSGGHEALHDLTRE